MELYINPKMIGCNHKYLKYLIWIITHFLSIFLRVLFNKKFINFCETRQINYMKNLNDESNEYIGVPVGGVYLELFKKEWFKSKIKVTFEDAEFYIPKGYDQLLRVSYNNYMELPSLEQRYPHHKYKIIKRTKDL